MPVGLVTKAKIVSGMKLAKVELTCFRRVMFWRANGELVCIADFLQTLDPAQQHVLHFGDQHLPGSLGLQSQPPPAREHLYSHQQTRRRFDIYISLVCNNGLRPSRPSQR
jgi:hypothetical protein